MKVRLNITGVLIMQNVAEEVHVYITSVVFECKTLIDYSNENYRNSPAPLGFAGSVFALLYFIIIRFATSYFGFFC